MFESLFGVHAPKGFDSGSQSAMLNQKVGNSSRLAILVPAWSGVGSAAGSLIFHCTLFPEPSLLE